MSRKRTLMPDIYKAKKRQCFTVGTGAATTTTATATTNSLDGEEENNKNDLTDIPSDTKASLLYLKSLFPLEKFESRLPPVVLKHQVYSIVKNRTLVDKQLADLKTTGEIKLFKFGTNANDFSILFTEDYTSHISRLTEDNGISKVIIDKFLNTVVRNWTDVSVNKEVMIEKFHFKDEEITHLVKASVLTVRDSGTWWLSIPNAGIFIKNLIRGRKAAITIIKKTKYKEIFKDDLEQRKWPRLARLGIVYHIHDIIGADLVDCIQTTNGVLLRLRE
ncbi:serine/threonine-protein kinase 19-like [Argonauta hians]